MPIAFSRTMRSLNLDSFSPSVVGLLVAIVFLIAWLAWFFLAQVGLYEVSRSAQVNDEGIILAEFPLEAQNQIWPGQPALLRLTTTLGDQPQTIPAIVMNMSRQPSQKRIQVELVALADPRTPIVLEEGLTGQVEIEVKRVSPATLVMYTTGQFVDGPAVSLSP